MWCVGGRRHSDMINQNRYEEVNPKCHKLVKVSRGNCSICGRNKSQCISK